MIKEKKQTNRGLALKLAALVIISGASAAFAETAELTVSGTLNDINSTLTVSGENFSDPDKSAHYNALSVESGGTLALNAGAVVTVANNSDHTAFFRVGYKSAGLLTIGDSATLTVGQLSRYANFHVGDGGYGGATGSGSVNQTGGSVTVLGSLNLGVNGGSGVYTVSGGKLTIDHANDSGHTSLATLGYNDTNTGVSSGELVIAGGTVSVTAHQYNGVDYGATSLILGDRANAANQDGTGSGVITQTGGALEIDNHATLYLSSQGDGVYNLNGGVLKIGGQSLQANYQNKGGSYAFNLGGGSIQVAGADLNTAVNINLSAGAASVIDTNGLNATVSGNLTAAGQHQFDNGGNALVKTGAGALTLSGSNRLDTFYALQGETRQTAGETSAMELAVGSGAGSAAAYTLAGGALTVTPSAENAGSLRVGDFGGSGTLTVSAGRLEVKDNGSLNIGNQGGSGVVNISGGEVAIGAGLHVIGRSAAGRAASSGELNISGGRLTVSAGGNLLLGNNQKEDASSAVVNHSGGAVTVENGANLWLSAKSSGGSVYNLTGGVLEIGGDSLRPHYNSANAYAFNLSGGTVKVIGSDLATDANLTLGAGASTIDTNGLNATVNGVIDGAGNLQKTGAGKLTVGNVTASGALTVSGGSLAVKNGGSVAMEVALRNGTTLEIDSTSIGAATLAALSTDAGATLAFTVGDNVSDVFNVSGDITIAAGTIFAVTALNGLDLETDHSWTLLTGNSLTFDGGTVNVSGGFDGKDAGNFSLSVSGNNLLLSYSAVPEPSVWSLTLVTLISGALLVSLKKRR